MGQYYIAIICANNNGKIVIKYAHSFCRFKLTEQAYINYIEEFENLLSPESPYYMSNLVWAGDYADPEPGSEENLYNVDKKPHFVFEIQPLKKLIYIVNHTKKVFIDKNNLKNDIHPLPILTAEGNGRGGGDYYGKNNHLAGTWARDIITMEYENPTEPYTEFSPDFSE